MTRSILFLLAGLLLVAAAGCDTNSELAEPRQEKEPYWWRSDPFFANKNVDEEATLALGDPNVVIGASEDPDPLQVAYQRIAENLIELYSEEHVGHIFLYHHEVVQNLKIPGVNIPEIKLPEPNVTVINHCDCPIEENNDPGCDPGGGGGGPPPPPPPPPPLMQIHMKELVCPGCSLRTLEAKGYIDARQLAQAIQFINFRVEKEGSPVYVPAQFLSNWLGSTFQHRKEFFVSGPKQTWQVTYKGRVTHIPGWPVYTQNKLAQNWL